jgi:hypothetical protein
MYNNRHGWYRARRRHGRGPVRLCSGGGGERGARGGREGGEREKRGRRGGEERERGKGREGEREMLISQRNV